MRNLTIALGLAIFALGGFYGGAKFESGKITTASTGAVVNAATTGAAGRATGNAGSGTTGAGGFTGNGALGGGAAGGFGGRGTFGQVTAISGSTLTVRDAQGNEVKVQLQPSTTVTKTAVGAQSDLSTGLNVTVLGQRGSDGTVAATSISIIPAGASIPGAAPSPRG